MQMKKNTFSTKRSFRLSKGYLILAIVFALLIGLATFNQAKAAIDTTKDTNEIKSVVAEALAAPVTLVVVPENTSSTSLAASAVNVPSLNVSIKLQATTSAIKAAHAHTQARFNNMYSSNSLIGHKLYGEIQNAIDGQSQGHYRALGGGVQNIDWRQILINGNQASVTVAATVWSHLKYTDEFGKVHIVTPTSGYVKICTLEKVNGHWTISSMVDDDLQADQLKVNHPAPQSVQGKPAITSPTANKGKVKK